MYHKDISTTYKWRKKFRIRSLITDVALRMLFYYHQTWMCISDMNSERKEFSATHSSSGCVSLTKQLLHLETRPLFTNNSWGKYEHIFRYRFFRSSIYQLDANIKIRLILLFCLNNIRKVSIWWAYVTPQKCKS